MAGIYTKIVATLLFPFHEWLKKHDTVAIHKQLDKSQWHSQELIKSEQASRLQTFIAQVTRQVPYYKTLFQTLELQASDIKSVSDLGKLPFLDKHTIKTHFEELKSNTSGPVSSFTTGGSSGNPLTFLLSNERVSHDVAEKWRATRWWNVDIGDKEIVAWGSPIELGAQDKVRVARDKLFRSTLIPAFDMDEAKLLAFIEQIQQEKPAMLFGYPSVFSLIAKTAQKEKIDLTSLGIKVVFVTSERLYPYQRDIIEQVFNAPVANGYGSRDAGFIAHQCPSGNMHISAEDLIVEIVDQQGSIVPEGEKGEIVVTHMATSDFPFIRYKTGDIAALDSAPCACGRGLPVLKYIEGRTTDFVVAANGTMMHGLALIYILRELDGIEEFKIIQETKLHTRIQIVPSINKAVPEVLKDKIIRGFKARLGDEVVIDLETVSQIEAEKSGKFRYVISKVS